MSEINCFYWGQRIINARLLNVLINFLELYWEEDARNKKKTIQNVGNVGAVKLEVAANGGIKLHWETCMRVKGAKMSDLFHKATYTHAQTKVFWPACIFDPSVHFNNIRKCGVLGIISFVLNAKIKEP